MRENPNKFRKYARIVWLVSVCLATLLGLILGGKILSLAVWVVILGTIAYFILLLLFWRCPYCGMIFPTKTEMEFSHCPHCGQDLPSADQ